MFTYKVFTPEGEMIGMVEARNGNEAYTIACKKYNHHVLHVVLYGYVNHTFTFKTKFKYGYGDNEEGTDEHYEVFTPVRDDGAVLWHYYATHNSEVIVIQEWFRLSFKEETAILLGVRGGLWTWAFSEDEAKKYFKSKEFEN